MPTHNFSTYETVRGGRELVLQQNKVWSHSPRIKGKLVLRPLPFNYTRNYVTFWKAPVKFPGVGLSGLGPGRGPQVPLSNQDLTNIAGQRYQKRLNQAQAALAISLVKWRDSFDMIRDRAQQMDRELERAMSSRKWRKRRFRIASDETANLYLEAKFGWAPLINDIYQSLEVLADMRIPPLHIRGSARENVMYSRRYTGNPVVTDTVSGYRRVTLSSVVGIENPNKWLASQLGLTDLGATAWDWIPWSFLVNMFSNMGAVIGQFSTNAGIVVMDKSTTYTLRALRESTSTYAGIGTLACNVNYNIKQRTVLNHPPITLDFRLPSDPLNAAATVVALVGQRARRVELTFKNLGILRP